MEHELGLTALFNQLPGRSGERLAAPDRFIWTDPSVPGTTRSSWNCWWSRCWWLRWRFCVRNLSVDKPGKLQHIFEMLHEFFTTTVHEVGIHHGEKYIPYIGTMFIFILSMNLIGIIPAFESPTMAPWVPAGLAIVTFIYFNAMGFSAQGHQVFGAFRGSGAFPNPIANVAIILFMLPIETVSVFIRPLSLTVRLYGNMFAGEQVTNVFLSLTKIVIPVIFMGLHVFVALGAGVRVLFADDDLYRRRYRSRRRDAAAALAVI